jgi:PhzF family phenazine biosynthesis protein
MPEALQFRQVDVFADKALAGNGLAVIITNQPLDTDLMQSLTRELRQFETIFLISSSQPNAFAAHVFTMEGELPFAGHPVLGAAAVLHERAGGQHRDWQLTLPAGCIEVSSQSRAGGYDVTMNQGQASFGSIIDAADELAWLEAFGLNECHRDPRLPMCVVSTGLPYLVVPVTSSGLSVAQISVQNLDEKLASIGAAFAYVFDLDELEGRTWDNQGATEDIATGSAAGPVAALLVRHDLQQLGLPFTLNQGRHVGRPSRMMVEIRNSVGRPAPDVMLTGSVKMVARGYFDDEAIGVTFPIK